MEPDIPDSEATGFQCIVCLQLNADMILVPCGHINLCEADCRKMHTASSLSACPVCQQGVVSFLKVQGLKK